MTDAFGNDYGTPRVTHRRRPNRRLSADATDNTGDATSTALTPEFVGLAVAFGNTLLFIGYEVNGLVEITVYPRYRFSSDDRVHAYIGYLNVPFGARWEEILSQANAISEEAQRNYRTAVTHRANEMRLHGSRYETAYDSITGIFRECWHGFALRLEREQPVVKSNITFQGKAPGPVLVTWRGEPYTLQVYTTGSILLLKGDRRSTLAKS